MKADVQAKKKFRSGQRPGPRPGRDDALHAATTAPADAKSAKSKPAAKPETKASDGRSAAKPGKALVQAKGRAKASGSDSRRIQVRRSGVHGKGVFALKPIAAGDRLIEYVGEVISWPEALRRHPHDPSQPDHTFYFHIDDENVIDGLIGGNASRWINHACEPNLEAQDEAGRIFLVALCDIQPGEELFFDYGLVIDERYTPALKKRFACRCGTPACRGTMLAPKRGGRKAG